jgi:hypothetical protein
MKKHKRLKVLERAMGFEPTTTCLGSKDSTTELRPLAESNPTLASMPSQETSGNYPVNSTKANFRRPIFRR